jgi:hypothetical protein
MPAHFVLKNGNEIVAHVFNNGEAIEKSALPELNPNEIDYIQASGDELAYIYETFSLLPHIPNRSVVKYYGDVAKFIAANW